MDAYCDYLRQATETKLSELRRQADEYRLARSLTGDAKARDARAGRSWFGLRARAARRAASRPMPSPVRLPRPMATTDEEIRRSA